jgi:hypothetical protein
MIVNQNEKKTKDKIENIKQQQAEVQLILSNKIIPHENHKVFEVNIRKRTITLAKYEPVNTTLHWHEALKMYYSRIFKKIDLKNAKTISKTNIIKKEGCLYIPALNKVNVKKILFRDYGLSFWEVE